MSAHRRLGLLCRGVCRAERSPYHPETPSPCPQSPWPLHSLKKFSVTYLLPFLPSSADASSSLSSRSILWHNSSASPRSTRYRESQIDSPNATHTGGHHRPLQQLALKQRSGHRVQSCHQRVNVNLGQEPPHTVRVLQLSKPHKVWKFVLVAPRRGSGSSRRPPSRM